MAAMAALAGCTAGPEVSPWAGVTPSASPSATASPSPSPNPTPSPTPSPTPEPLAWGPTVADLEAATETAAAMTPEQVAGQLIVARWSGTDPATAAELVGRLGLAGVILMGENVASAEQVAAVATAVQQAAADAGRDWPAVVAIDEEGGRVSRLRGLVRDTPAFAEYGALGDDAATGADFLALGQELAALGITVDLAPVADVTIGAADVTIGDRSASADPQVAARTVVAALTGLAEAGVAAAVKHFPGHGSVTADSHVTLPVQGASLPELLARDLVPFGAAVDAGVPLVMVGHLDVTALDPGVPSSLSAATYALLREELGFTGVAVTDALDMGAITGLAEPGEAAVRAVAAGADLLLMPADPEAARDAVVAALAEGSLDRQRVDQAAGRVIALMRYQATRSP